VWGKVRDEKLGRRVKERRRQRSGKVTRKKENRKNFDCTISFLVIFETDERNKEKERTKKILNDSKKKDERTKKQT